jgi:hypothetical protein
MFGGKTEREKELSERQRLSIILKWTSENMEFEYRMDSSGYEERPVTGLSELYNKHLIYINCCR